MSSTHCSYALRIGVSVAELQGSERLISLHFNAYISIARTGNFIMYALGPFSRKRSHIVYAISLFSCFRLQLLSYTGADLGGGGEGRQGPSLPFI